MTLTHFDDAPAIDYAHGHLRGHWTLLGEAAGCRRVGVRRITLPAGGWSTPAHEHGRGEEIFYVLAGSGISWQRGQTAPVSAGDCIVYLPRKGAHSLRADDGGLDVLAFGPREYDEAVRFPQLEMSLLGGRAVHSEAGPKGVPVQFQREADHGPPPVGDTIGERPSTIVNVADVEAVEVRRERVSRARRNLGRAAGSVDTGLKHVVVAAGHEATALHCHSAEEEIFVILDGTGWLQLGEEETSIRPGHVVSRPAGSGVAHGFRAQSELTMLAYGTREPGDLCYYPRSAKIAFSGLGIMARVDQISDYWDGED